MGMVSVRLLSFSWWPLAQYGLQLIAGLDFDEKVSQFVVKIGLEIDPAELQRALQNDAFCRNAGAGGIFCKLRVRRLGSSKGLRRIAFWQFQRQCVNFSKRIVI